MKLTVTVCKNVIRPALLDGADTWATTRAKEARLEASSSIVYHRIIYSTQYVGAMLWSMAQLRKGQLRMVVDVVGSC